MLIELTVMVCVNVNVVFFRITVNHTPGIQAQRYLFQGLVGSQQIQQVIHHTALGIAGRCCSRFRHDVDAGDNTGVYRAVYRIIFGHFLGIPDGK